MQSEVGIFLLFPLDSGGGGVGGTRYIIARGVLYIYCIQTVLLPPPLGSSSNTPNL